MLDWVDMAWEIRLSQALPLHFWHGLNIDKVQLPYNVAKEKN